MATIAAGLLPTPVAAEAQSTPEVHTIGFLGPPPSAGGLVQAFQNGLRDLGYEHRYTDVAFQGDLSRLAQLATEIVRLEEDVLVVSVTAAALA